MRGEHHRVGRGVRGGEALPPEGDQLLVIFQIVRVALREVGLALVPQDARDGEGHQRLEHPGAEVPAGEPLGDRGAARRGGDEAHGHAEGGLDILGEEIARRGNGRERLAVGDLPLIAGRLAPARRAAAAQVDADLRVGGLLQFGAGQVIALAGRRLPAAAHLIGHVGLSGSEPDFAEDHVGETEGLLFALDLQDIVLAVGLGGR